MTLHALLARLPPLRHRPTLQRLVHEQGHALTHLGEGERRGPCFAPARLPVPGTMWPVTPACDAAATRAHGAPHRRPHPLHSGSAGDMRPGAGPLGPPGPMPPVASRGQPWTGTKPPAPPAPGRGHGSGGPPTSPERLVDADGCARPRGSAPLPPPAALDGHRAHPACARRSHPAPGSRPRRGARDAGDGAPGRSPQAARPPHPASTGAQARPTRTAHPRPHGDDDPYGRPLSSSPASPRGGRAAPWCARLARATGGRVREARDAVGPPALSRRACSWGHACGRDRRVATTGCPVREPSPTERAPWP
jgi:hypothetical protein